MALLCCLVFQICSFFLGILQNQFLYYLYSMLKKFVHLLVAKMMLCSLLCNLIVFLLLFLLRFLLHLHLSFLLKIALRLLGRLVIIILLSLFCLIFLFRCFVIIYCIHIRFLLNLGCVLVDGFFRSLLMPLVLLLILCRNMSLLHLRMLFLVVFRFHFLLFYLLGRNLCC